MKCLLLHILQAHTLYQYRLQFLTGYDPFPLNIVLLLTPNSPPRRICINDFFVLQYYFKCLLVYISFILFFFSYNDSFLNICYSFAMTINNVFSFINF